MKVLALRDGIEEVGVDKFFPGIPDVAVLLVNNRVLVGVIVVSGKARQSSEEVCKGNEVGSEGGEEADGR